jgi:nucleoside-diphosphate-sugar epimerase
VRDLTFVTDTVQGFVLASERPASIGQTINLGQGEGVSIGDLAKNILRLMKVDKPLIADERRTRPEKSEVLRLICNNQLAASVLAWKPTVSLNDGLTRTIEWLSAHRALYKSHVYNR